MKKRYLILLSFMLFLVILCSVPNVSNAAICSSIGHNYVLHSSSAAGCTYSGYKSYNCTRCGGSRTTTISALGHSWGSYTITKNSDCTSTGTMVRYCGRCGASSSKTTAALGHAWVVDHVLQNVSCTTNEITLYECVRCFGAKREVTRSALGHNYVMTQGNSEQHWKDCSRCSSTTGYEGHYDNTYDGYCDVCGREWYLAPTKPTITVKDTAGNVLTSTWTNKDMKVYVDGSRLTAGLGGVGYKYQMNGASYSVYSSPVSYTKIQTDTTFYAKSYNTGRSQMESAVVTRVLPKIERENPTFKISIDSSEYEKSHTATITFGDTGGSKLKATNYTVSYTWTNSTATPSSYDNTMNVSVAESNQTTATITKNTGTGIYHLHVKLNKKITDNATNECATTTLTIPFYMDNTSPVIAQKVVESNPVALNAGATYSMDFLVTEEHSGLVTSEFTATDIIVRVNGVESTAKKTLTYKSVSNNKYEYNLKITNVTETGLITMEIKQDSIPDYATNKCVKTSFELTKKNGDNFIGPYGDNVIPVVSMPGEVTLVTVPADKNLSGIVDKRYVNQYYTVEIPLRILDVGGQDFVDILETKDLIVKAGTIELTPSTKTIRLNSQTVVADATSRLSKYQKDYTLTLSGLLEDGFLELTSVNASVKDLAGNVNVTTKFSPYTNATGASVRVLVDNTKPQPTIRKVLTPTSVHGTTSVGMTLYIKELGSGIRDQQFVMSDMGLQVNGKNVTTNVNPNLTTTLTPNSLNNYQTALGKDNPNNYTFDLRLSGIEDNGSLRIQVVANNIIDKANNGNDPVTLDVNTVIDNEGPKLGPVTTNADKNGEVLGETIEVTITDCSDPSGIARYEWQRSEDGINFVTVYTEDSVLTRSTLEDIVDKEKKYYYRVIVSDTLGNTSTSEVVSVVYRSTIDGKPTLRLSKDQISSTIINIDGVIKSKSTIVKVTVDGSEIPKSYYQNNVKVNNYEITTTFTWPVTQNGVYEFTATDEKGNVVVGTINVSEFDFSESIITPEKKDATLLTPAQIIFTANEPVRIIDDDAYPGFTFDTDDFSTKIIATVSPDVDFDETMIFDFENKGLVPVPVPVDPPLITRFAYLRFASINVGNLNMTVEQISGLVKNMRSAKVAIASGQIKSYYGFKNENVDTKISTQADINAAEKLGSASETFVISENGQLVKLQKDEQISVTENGNYTTGNVTGMYQRTSGLLDNYSDSLLNDTTIKHQKFRMTIVP